jgi:hypothetical protein
MKKAELPRKKTGSSKAQTVLTAIRKEPNTWFEITADFSSRANAYAALAAAVAAEGPLELARRDKRTFVRWNTDD